MRVRTTALHFNFYLRSIRARILLDLDRGPAWQQVLALGTVLVVVSTIVNVGWSAVGAVVGRRARRWIGSRRTAITVGLAYVALAIVAFVAAAG